MIGISVVHSIVLDIKTGKLAEYRIQNIFHQDAQAPFSDNASLQFRCCLIEATNMIMDLSLSYGWARGQVILYVKS